MKIVDVVCQNVVKKYFYYGDVKSISIDKVGEKLLNVNCVVNSDTRFEYNIIVTNECRNYYTLHLFTKNKEIKGNCLVKIPFGKENKERYYDFKSF